MVSVLLESPGGSGHGAGLSSQQGVSQHPSRPTWVAVMVAISTVPIAGTGAGSHERGLIGRLFGPDLQASFPVTSRLALSSLPNSFRARPKRHVQNSICSKGHLFQEADGRAMHRYALCTRPHLLLYGWTYVRPPRRIRSSANRPRTVCSCWPCRLRSMRPSWIDLKVTVGLTPAS